MHEMQPDIEDRIEIRHKLRALVDDADSTDTRRPFIS